MKSSSATQEAQILEKIPQVKIDDEGVFKYILIKCDIGENSSIYFVRGSGKYEFHAENYEQFLKDLKKIDLFTVKPKM